MKAYINANVVARLKASLVQLAAFFSALFLDYRSRVIGDGGTISSPSKTDTAYANIPQQDSVEFAWLGVAGSKKRTSGILNFFTKLYSMLPIPAYGDELVVNGDFSDGTTGWNPGSGAELSAINNQLIVTLPSGDSFGNGNQAINIISGHRYLFKCTIVSTTGTVGARIDGTALSYDPISDDFSTVGYHESNFIADRTGEVYVQLGVGVDGATSIFSDVSVKEVLVKDATQTTEADQPYVSGDIAPNENEGMNNPNGESRYMEHDEISFAANEAWTVTTVLNWNGTEYTTSLYCGKESSNSSIGIKSGGVYLIRAINAAGVSAYSGNDLTKPFLGKNTVVTLSAAGDGFIKYYFDGNLIGTFTLSSEFNFNSLIKGRNIGEQFFGKLPAHIIHSTALTPTEIADFATYLQGLYPPIPSVEIGTQEWATSNVDMVSTPMGTVIPEVTDAATWATSQTIYDDAITGGATVYEATEAAAMWCYYNNDSSLGATYGKLYNWFAVSLLQLDITTHGSWGWHVPTEAEFTTLQTALGGASVAGGKMKMTGTDYWNSPNTGASNNSGFTMLGTGRRNPDGIFNAYSITSYTNGIDAAISATSTSASMIVGAVIRMRGYPIRLIKDS